MKPKTAAPKNPKEDFADLKRTVVSHYEAALQTHGPTAQGMDWKDEASQRLRFRLLCEICDLNGKSIHEVGAGAGHLCDFLNERGGTPEYSGSDLSAEMVDAARKRHPGVRFDRWDLLAELNLQSYDVLVCSGLFHVRVNNSEDDWRDFVRSMVRRMYGLCRVGIAFNLMTDQVDFKNDRLYYSNPGEMLDFCRRELSRYVTVRHDYRLYEYTTYVYRNPTG